MERLFVFADFNWLGKGELVGELCYEKLRGSGSFDDVARLQLRDRTDTFAIFQRDAVARSINTVSL